MNLIDVYFPRGPWAWVITRRWTSVGPILPVVVLPCPNGVVEHHPHTANVRASITR